MRSICLVSGNLKVHLTPQQPPSPMPHRITEILRKEEDIGRRGGGMKMEMCRPKFGKEFEKKKFLGKI